MDLGDSDHIVIFFTPNARSIDLSDLARLGSAHLEIIEVPSGKQSADMHIGSFLGYLVGKYQSECRVIIVSKDADYDRVLDFWKIKKGVEAQRRVQVGGGIPEPAPEPEAMDGPFVKVDGDVKCQLNGDIMRALIEQGFPPTVFNPLAKLTVKLAGHEPFPEMVWKALEEEKIDDAEAVFKAIAPVLLRYSGNWSSPLPPDESLGTNEQIYPDSAGTTDTPTVMRMPAATNTSTAVNASKATDVPLSPVKGKGELNREIQKTLSAAGYNNEIISFTASTAVKNWLKENYKQQIHKAIVQKYGQEAGLQIYYAIKKCL